ncbi:MAG: VOC family protein [Alphaproteobacteria bacterium]|nr:VOC family protein [Alphaproteobacteria bacterium]MCB9931402.1 VOC family protein [Alphaproteobacteria bacterium]
MSVGLLDHYNIRTAKLAETVGFYEKVLGLKDGDRPNFAFPGAWLYSEGRPVLHLIDISGSGEGQKDGTGCIDHIAFVSNGFEAMKTHLESTGYEYEARIVPGGKLWQIFVRDPNGLLIELNYDAAAEQAA